MTWGWVKNYLEGIEEFKSKKKVDMVGFLNSEQIRAKGIKCGDGCLLHETALVYNPEHVVLGNHVRIDGYTILSPSDSGSIRFGDHVHVSSFVCIFGAFVCNISDFCNIASGCKIYSCSDDFGGESLIGPTVPVHTRVLHHGPVTMEPFSVMGANSILMPNATLGFGSALLANSMLMAGMDDDYMILWGSPVKNAKPRSKSFLKHLKLFPVHQEKYHAATQQWIESGGQDGSP
jgi:carbonic anhydrase/acetyltransferase-like protein (isoleucine patch superfamily)